MGKSIFVFGSNLAGRHGAGAALHAKQMWGAQYGVGVGPTGNAYAIPTKDTMLKTLPLRDIELYVDRFIQYAIDHSYWTFILTPIGTGLAGYKVEQIRPMFKDAPANVVFHKEWNK